MSDLLEEANQDYAYNKRVNIFKKFLPLIIVCTFVAVLTIAVKDWYYNKKSIQYAARTEMLFGAFDSQLANNNLNIDIFSELLKEKDGISNIAEAGLIAEALKSGRMENALNLASDLIKNSHDQLTKNYAIIIYSGILLDKQDLTDKDGAQIIQKLSSIQRGEALYSISRVYLCLYYIKTGNYTDAKNIINDVNLESDKTEHLALIINALKSHINLQEQK